jgi:hypothetical protein
MRNEEFKELQEFEEFKELQEFEVFKSLQPSTRCGASSNIACYQSSRALLRSGSLRQLLPA